jgi:hypothetical protein
MESPGVQVWVHFAEVQRLVHWDFSDVCCALITPHGLEPHSKGKVEYTSSESCLGNYFFSQWCVLDLSTFVVTKPYFWHLYICHHFCFLEKNSNNLYDQLILQVKKKPAISTPYPRGFYGNTASQASGLSIGAIFFRALLIMFGTYHMTLWLWWEFPELIQGAHKV